MTDSTMLEIVKMANETVKKTAEINKRLTILTLCIAIIFGATVTAMCGFYFLSDYEYPTVEQQAVQGDQQLKQNIK